MKRGIFLSIIFITSGVLFSQAPVVSNVDFSQRTDGSLIVDIYYDLSDTDGETKTIEIEASDDNGATWYLTCTSLTGDVGAGITLGTGKHVEWDFYADNPHVSGNSYKVRVTASEVGTVTGNDGTVYQTVKIGDQWWMAENLKETMYQNGDAVPEVTDASTWAGLSTGARCVYDNNEANADTYGYLYNWYAVDDSRNIAPPGWHVPSDDEWKQLEMYLGMSQSEADHTGYRGTNEGSKMAGNAALWTDGNLENNAAFGESGLSALPGGYRGYSSHFYNLGGNALFWSSTEYGSSGAWYRALYYFDSDVYRYHHDKAYGLSVRCVRD